MKEKNYSKIYSYYRMSVDECYIFKQYDYPDGLFEKSIDATYIIYLNGSKRISNILSQLEEYHPSKRVYLLMNKGYKECKKNLLENRTPSDIIDANITIFKHSQQHNYSNILILEDDFIFSKDVKNPTHITNINSFLLENKKGDFIYQLGCMPVLSIPYTLTTYFTFSWAAHANIYSAAAQHRFINDYMAKKINSKTASSGLDWYIFMNNIYTRNLYMYYKPLCYQIFTKTENQSEWILPGPLKDTQMFFINFFLRLFGVDKAPEPGTSIIYLLSQLLFLLLVIVFIYITRILFQYFKFYSILQKKLKYKYKY